MTPSHDVVCVVPARMASTRFPGKPLVEILGVPLVVRSARRALAAGCFQRVVVATEDEAIAQVCTTHGIPSLLTPIFPTGTDRVAWAGKELGARWILNLQGDEPVFPLDLLRKLAHRLPEDPTALWTASDTHLEPEAVRDPDVVKVVSDPARPDRAEDFRREIPNELQGRNWMVHVGVYGGSVEALSRFSALSAPPEETERRIEPLRALAHGMPVILETGSWARAAIDRMEHISGVLPLIEREGDN